MRNTTLLHAFVLMSSSVFVACGGAGDGTGETGEAVGSQKSAVQGGKVDTNTTDTFAVGIASKRGAVCSGTLIAPNLVLTARHCVVPPTADEAVTCADKFANNVSPSELLVTTEANLFRAKTFHDVTAIATPDDKAFCGNDIAVITLADNIDPADATPATPVVQFQMTDTSKISGNITAIGYGITSPSSEDSGIRRIREDIKIVCVPGSDTNECTGQYKQMADSDAEFVTEGYVCSGDSGSGAFEQTSFSAGTPYVLGALSRGPQTDTTCLAAIYSRTDAHAELIINAAVAAAEQGGYDAPSWTQSEAADPTGTDTPCEGDDCTSVPSETPATTAPKTTTVTTTSGCSSAPGRTTSAGSAFVALAAAALVLGRRRSRSSAG